MRRAWLLITLPAMFVLLVALLASAARAEGPGQDRSLPWIETGGFAHADHGGLQTTQEGVLRHERNRARPGGRTAPDSADIGDVWVVVADDHLLFRWNNPFDLRPHTTLRFDPLGGAEFVVSKPVGGPPQGISPGAGTVLDLGDDDTAEVPFPAGFPFLGTTYASVWVNSDGNITLGEGDAAHTRRDAYRHVAGPPRLSPLLTDLDPTCRGEIRVDVQPDRLIVVWDQVVHFVRGALDGCGPSVPSTTVLAVLHADGAIEFVYDSVDDGLIGRPGPNREAVIGLAEGGFAGPFNDVDLSEDLTDVFDVGAVFEQFSSTDGTTPPVVDLVQLARDFYESHEDKYDFLVLFTKKPVDMGVPGAFAVNYPVRNETRGIGLPPYDFSGVLGSDGELESFLHMNSIELYWPDAPQMVDPPIKMFSAQCLPHRARLGLCARPPGADLESQRARQFGTIAGFGPFTLGLRSAMSLMAEEVGHRWLAYTPFRHPMTGEISPDLLGRDFVHWSFFFDTRVPDAQFAGDTRSSSLEGNAIVDLGAEGSEFCSRPGEGTFLHEPDELMDGYSELDQYLMGLRPAAEVGPFWYVDEPRLALPFDWPIEHLGDAPPQDDFLYCGTRVDLSLDNIRSVVGPRVPAIGDEVDQDAAGNDVPDVKTMAFILLVPEGSPHSPAHAAAIEWVDTLRETWEWYANGPATGARGRFDTSLNPEVH